MEIGIYGIFHRLTQSVKRMMFWRGFEGVVVYLDDFLVVGKTLKECQEAFKTLCDFLEELGFTISTSRVVEPCQKLAFLGVEITYTLTLSLPQQKLQSQGGPYIFSH